METSDYPNNSEPVNVNENNDSEPVNENNSEPPVNVTENNDRLIAKLKEQQNFSYALVGGTLAALVSAALWAVITVLTKYQIGYMAIAIGFIVGFAVRFFGQGIDKKFGYLGAALSLLGCLIGNLFSQIGFIAHEYSMGYIEALSLLNVSSIVNIMTESFSVMDILFYGLAISAGYKCAFRMVTPEYLQEIENGNDATPKYHGLRMPLIVASVVILCFLSFLIVNGENGPKTYTYDSGKLMSEGELKNSKLHGTWTYYYEEGGVQLVGIYEKGTPTGKWEWYDENGNTTKTGHYERGLENGVWINYYDNKVVSDSVNYVNGRKNGYWVQYYPDGKVAQSGSVKRDLNEGTWTYFYDNGQVHMTGEMKNGVNTGEWTSYFENGQKSEEVFYDQEGEKIIRNAWDKTGKQLIKDGSGTYSVFSPEGILLSSGELVDGKMTGDWKYYKPDGSLESEGKFEGKIYRMIQAWDKDKQPMLKDGSGTYTSYYSDSEVVCETGEYKDGLREGTWIIYHPDGENIFLETNYIAGKLNGVNKQYYDTGILYLSGTHADDLPDGEWIWYYNNGNIMSSATFVKGKKEGKQTMWNEYNEKTKEEWYSNGEFEKEKLFL